MECSARVCALQICELLTDTEPAQREFSTQGAGEVLGVDASGPYHVPIRTFYGCQHARGPGPALAGRLSAQCFVVRLDDCLGPDQAIAGAQDRPRFVLDYGTNELEPW